MSQRAAVGTDVAAARLLRQRLVAGRAWLAVSGRSMWPTIKPSAHVLVEARDRPRPGEVWAFVAPDGAIVVHRFDRAVAGRYQFRGDGLDRADPVVSPLVVVGRVRAVHDRDGWRRLGLRDRVTGVLTINIRRLGRLVRRIR